jgi:hypothetical protein
MVAASSALCATHRQADEASKRLLGLHQALDAAIAYDETLRNSTPPPLQLRALPACQSRSVPPLRPPCLDRRLAGNEQVAAARRRAEAQLAAACDRRLDAKVTHTARCVPRSRSFRPHARPSRWLAVLLSVGCCLLLAVCCLLPLSAVCCLLPAATVCCLLPAACLPVCCLLAGPPLTQRDDGSGGDHASRMRSVRTYDEAKRLYELALSQLEAQAEAEARNREDAERRGRERAAAEAAQRLAVQAEIEVRDLT